MRPGGRRWIAGALAWVVAGAGVAAHAADIAIEHVTVIDTAGGPSLRDRTVLVRGERIAAVRPSNVPVAGVRRVDGRGKFLIPGLWDMETHLSWSHAAALPILVANGVTGVRDLGGDYGELLGWRDDIAAGRRIGPTIRTVGPMLNGRSFNRYQLAIDDPGQARGVVKLLKFEGVDGVEVERRVPRDVYFALAAETKAQGLPLVGHVPITVSPMEAAGARQASIDNIETFYDGVFRAAHQADFIGGVDSFLKPGGEGEVLFSALHADGVAVTPVLGALRRILDLGEAADRPAAPRLTDEARYLSASNRKPPVPLTAADVAELRAEYPRLLATVARLRAAGVVLLAGSDLAGDRVPGFSLQDELQELVRAGLTPLQALQAATRNPAAVMKLETDFGAIAPGRVADLVLLDADPTKDIAATRRIRAVVLRGRLLDRRTLDRLLSQAARQAAGE